MSMSLLKCKSCVFLLVGPMLENDSISSVARKKSKDDIFDQMPIFSHWFGLALYEVYIQAKQQLSANADELTLKIENNSYNICRNLLETTSAKIRKAAEMGDGDHKEYFGIRASEALCRSEPAFSLVVSFALNTLCFHEFRNAGIQHQGPIRKKRKTCGNPDIADVVGFKFVLEAVMETFFVSDIKLNDYDISVKESALYGKFASMRKGRKSCVLVMGLAATRSTASLWLYVMARNREWAIPILRYCTLWDHVLLATLCAGLRYLADCPVTYSVIEYPMPFKENPQPLKTSFSNRTYRVGNEVQKIFDNEDEIVKGNQDILIMAGVNATVKYLSTDKRFYTLNYPYYEGNHSPTDLGQFKAIISMLNKIHSGGYVHGDVRLPNLVFGNTGTDGYLIDFDLSRHVSSNSVYPLGYLSDEKIRHNDARAGKIMCMKHDRHSLSIIIDESFENDSRASKVSSMLKSNMTLECILQEWPTD